MTAQQDSRELPWMIIYSADLVVVRETDCEYFRFLWWPNGDIKQIKSPSNTEWKCKLFGATSSPGCASYGFKYIASQEKQTYPSAARFVTHDFYVDDGLACVESAKQAKDLTQGAREICKTGSLRLNKFIANNCARISTRKWENNRHHPGSTIRRTSYGKSHWYSVVRGVRLLQCLHHCEGPALDQTGSLSFLCIWSSWISSPLGLERKEDTTGNAWPFIWFQGQRC